MYVCHCEAVSDRAVNAAISSGARCIEDVTESCRAGGGCGSCHDTLQALLDLCTDAPEMAEASAA